MQVFGKTIIASHSLVGLLDLQSQVRLGAMCLIGYADDVCPFRQELRAFGKLMYRGKEHATAGSSCQMFSKFIPAFHFHHTFITNELLDRSK